MRLTFLFCVGWLVTSIQCDWNETNDTDLASSTTLKVLKSFVDSKLITFPPYEHYPQDKDEFSKHMLRGSDDPDVSVDPHSTNVFLSLQFLIGGRMC